MMDKVLKGFVLKQVIDVAAKDASKYMKKRLKNFDADLALHKVGLARYKPASFLSSGVSLLALGAAVGAVAALAFAPKKGTELRADLMKRFQPEDTLIQPPAPATQARVDTPPIARV